MTITLTPGSRSLAAWISPAVASSCTSYTRSMTRRPWSDQKKCWDVSEEVNTTKARSQSPSHISCLVTEAQPSTHASSCCSASRTLPMRIKLGAPGSIT